MTAPTTVTCGDLAMLGNEWDRLARHDPRRMDVEHDTLCHCHAEPPGERIVSCHSALVTPVGPDFELHVCCLCNSWLGDVLRAHQGHSYGWMLDQLREAVEYRDRRSLDGSACPRDMDVEAAAVNPPEPWEPRYYPTLDGCCVHGALLMARCPECEAEWAKEADHA